MTAATQKAKKKAVGLTVISWMLTIGPVVFYVAKGFFSGSLAVQKATLALSVMVAVIMTLISMINKTAIRSRIWIIAFGLYAVVDHFLALIVIFGVTQIADEIIVSPLASRAREAYRTNREIDKREQQS